MQLHDAHLAARMPNMISGIKVHRNVRCVPTKCRNLMKNKKFKKIEKSACITWETFSYTKQVPNDEVQKT